MLIDDVKLALRVTHSNDDTLLQRLIDAATMECIAYCNITIPDGETTVSLTENIINGIVLMVQADYDGDPFKRNDYLAAAYRLWDAVRTYYVEPAV